MVELEDLFREGYGPFAYFLQLVYGGEEFVVLGEADALDVCFALFGIGGERGYESVRAVRDRGIF